MNPTLIPSPVLKAAPSPFRDALADAVARKIAVLRQGGVVSMGFDCLKMNVHPPSSHLVGAPLGTNGRYYYAHMFRNIVDELPPHLRTFVED